MNNSKLYIVMPAYNEAENIEKTIQQWHPVVEKLGADSKLIIANDGSKDNTIDIMRGLVEKYPKLLPMDKPNSGHGATLMFLYNRAVDDGADYVFQTDSDGQTDPEEFWEFWNNKESYDFQIGTRGSREDGGQRVFVTKVLKFVVWMMFGEAVADANTPFRLMKVERLKPILDVIPNDFFLSNVVISTIVVKWNEKVNWYPITFKPRQGGVNSINFKRIVGIGWKALGDFRSINKRLKSR